MMKIPSYIRSFHASRRHEPIIDVLCAHYLPWMSDSCWSFGTNLSMTFVKVNEYVLIMAFSIG